MVDYVVGLMFNAPFAGVGWPEEVLLIEKDRPEWQAGLHNGVGGKIEPGEFPEDAMVREFKEETGVDFTDWTSITTISTRSGERVFVYGAVDRDAFLNAKTMESEPIHRVHVGDITEFMVKTVASIPYLVELARYILCHQDLTVQIATGEYVE